MNKNNVTIENLQQRLEELHPNYKIIYLSYYGSKLFGLNNANSDTDYFGLFIPSKEDILLKKDIHFVDFNTNPENKNSAEDNDIKFCSIYEFFRLLRRGDHEKFDLLFSMFSPSMIFESEESNIIKNNYKDLLINKPDAFVGFALKQSNKYSVKGNRLQLIEDVINLFKTDLKLNKNEPIKINFPKIKELFKDNEYISFNQKEEGEYISILNREYVQNTSYHHFMTHLHKIKDSYGERANLSKNAKGVDFKAFCHAFRAMAEAEELLLNHYITLPLRPEDKTFIKDVKEGKYTDLEYLSNLIEDKMDNLNKLKKISTLPEQLNPDIVDNILKEIFSISFK